ncbi:MAG: hypothetical protein RI909_1477 [Bacteroidota bacterium]
MRRHEGTTRSCFVEMGCFFEPPRLESTKKHEVVIPAFVKILLQQTPASLLFMVYDPDVGVISHLFLEVVIHHPLPATDSPVGFTLFWWKASSFMGGVLTDPVHVTDAKGARTDGRCGGTEGWCGRTDDPCGRTDGRCGGTEDRCEGLNALFDGI